MATVLSRGHLSGECHLGTLMIGPMIVLYEVSIVCSQMLYRGEEAPEPEDSVEAPAGSA